jgi:hypothetical protein
MFYDREKNDHGMPHNPFKSLIVPRPIGWISTVSAEGVHNLAPYSQFQMVNSECPYVMVGWLSFLGTSLKPIQAGILFGESIPRSLAPRKARCFHVTNACIERRLQMSDRNSAVLAALRSLTTEGNLLELQDWQSVAREAFSGSAPAQYIVAIGFEELGDVSQARHWYQLSAAQGYLPAISKLTGQSSVPLPSASLFTDTTLR